MKRKILFPMLAVVLAVALTVPMALVSAHEEEDPYVTDLLAGQTEDVGDVKVWNDGDNLYITYEITDLDWIITETHLYAGKNVPPTTAPGQFPYDDDDATSVSDTVVTYAIPLADIDSYSMQVNKKGKPTGVMIADGTPGVEPCNDVYIAAHAVVQKVEIETSTEQPELTWQRSAETAGAIAHFPGYGGQWDPETDGFAIPLDETQVVWDNGAYHTAPGTPTGSFASWNYKGAVGTQGPSYDPSYGSDLRRFHANFTMPDGCTVTGGTLSTVGFDGIPINDNVYVFVNEDLIFWGGTRANVLPTFEGMSGIQALSGATDPSETDRWYIPGMLPPLTNLVSGTNHIDVFTEENERWGGLGELVLSLDCETVITTTETAWGNGIDFEHPNWAMYFGYHIQEPPPPCPFPLVGNTENISWGLRVIGPVAYPNDTPVTFTGTVNASGLQSNGAVFIGLVDKDYVDSGESGWMGGAYTYFGRGASSNDLRVGPTDGNFDGEIVQVFKTYTDYFSAPTNINFTMVIYNGNITVTLDSTDYVDTYGEIKALNSKTAYLWNEFEYGAYIAVDTWPYAPYGVNDVSYDVLVDWCHE